MCAEHSKWLVFPESSRASHAKLVQAGCSATATSRQFATRPAVGNRQFPLVKANSDERCGERCRANPPSPPGTNRTQRIQTQTNTNCLIIKSSELSRGLSLDGIPKPGCAGEGRLHSIVVCGGKIDFKCH